MRPTTGRISVYWSCQSVEEAQHGHVLSPQFMSSIALTKRLYWKGRGGGGGLGHVNSCRGGGGQSLTLLQCAFHRQILKYAQCPCRHLNIGYRMTMLFLFRTEIPLDVNVKLYCFWASLYSSLDYRSTSRHGHS